MSIPNPFSSKEGSKRDSKRKPVKTVSVDQPRLPRVMELPEDLVKLIPPLLWVVTIFGRHSSDSNFSIIEQVALMKLQSITRLERAQNR